LLSQLFIIVENISAKIKSYFHLLIKSMAFCVPHYSSAASPQCCPELALLYSFCGNFHLPEFMYWIDKNGYLHFTTELAGDIVVSEGTLERK